MNPLNVSARPPVPVSDVFESVRLADAFTASVSFVPLSVPPPVQPLIVNVLPPLLVSVKVAVLISLRPSDMAPDDNDVLLSVKPPALLAATVSPAPAPVQRSRARPARSR